MQAGGRIIFTSEPNINAEQLITLIQTQAQCYKFDGADKLRFIKPFETTEQKIEFINGLLEKLSLETAMKTGIRTYEPSISFRLHLVGRGPASRRLQAIRLRQGHPAVHRPPQARLRAG